MAENRWAWAKNQYEAVARGEQRPPVTSDVVADPAEVRAEIEAWEAAQESRKAG